MLFKVIRFTVLAFTVIWFTLVLSSTAFAAAVGFVGVCNENIYYEYNYEDLLDSLALKIIGQSNGLFECFSEKKVFAVLDDKKGYIDYNAILDHYAAVILTGDKFSLNAYTESKGAVEASMPSSIKVVGFSSEKIKYADKVIGVTSTGANPDYVPNKTRVLILGEALIPLEKVRDWATSREADKRFIDIADQYWQYGQKTGIRPEVLYAQAAVETNFGKYTGVVDPAYNNWAGIKKKDATGDTLTDHEIFASPELGVLAHFNHIAAYVGLEPIGEAHDRYHTVNRQTWAGSVLYVEDLSGKWAPASDYHTYILPLIQEMENFKGVEQISVDAVREEETEESNSDRKNKYQVMVNVDVLHLRQGPGTTYNILDRLSFGALLTVSGNQNEWLKVLTGKGQDGWVHSDYVREVAENSDSLQGITIIIDPGHGGSDPGARGYSGYLEKTFNLAVARKLAFLLREAGAEVIMTRSGDQTVSNVHRVDLANSSRGDLFISIHANAFFNSESNGIETLYYNGGEYNEESSFLAGQLQNKLVTAIGLRNRGVKSSSYYVLTGVNMPSALVEVGFLTNPAEEEILRSEENQDKIAAALFDGIKAYYRYRRQ